MSTNRRDLLIGGACIAAAGAALALKPRSHVALLARGATMNAITPRAFGDWSSRDVSNLVAPKIPGSLMAKLYNETVERTYAQAASGIELMMLLAYGDTQTNDLQLHRPEVCYPAFGFALSGSARVELPLSPGSSLPARKLVARAPERQEHIVYWSRLGEYLPQDEGQQRSDRLATAMHGVIADGLLARFSVVADDAAAAFAVVQGFIPALMRAVAPAHRAALIGTQRAQAMSAAGI